jgi:leucyl aminopeptidase (aminopeptidase T)
MTIEPAILRGAEQIIQRCLGLASGQDLVVFVDETTIETGVVIADAADRLGVPQTVILVPVNLQRRIPKETDLSSLTQVLAREARAILTCVNSTADCLPFRDHILETQWSARMRIGHMPGANLDVLKLANVDFDQLSADCRRIQLAMARGQMLELMSYASDGTAYRLAADIGGWERLPVASDGVIDDGVWGNVPSGETYIAPIHGSGNGSVVIDGSIPGMVIEPGNEIVLHFERGHLAHIEPAESPAAQWLYQTQIEKAQAHEDQNWSNLAEIGIGVNPGVDHLTSNMLFDEKMAGTAHIALGTNTFMGGTVDATIHCDMVVKAPTIVIDGKTILKRGELRFVESEWHETYSEIDLEESPVSAAAAVARSGVQVDETSNGRLQRVLRSEPGRVFTYSVGDDRTAQLAHALYSLLPDDGGWLPIEEIATDAEMNAEIVRRILHVIWSYDLIKLASVL